ncbi:MAG: hypothetical protein ACPHHR_06515 [Cycloclasticus sp.]
MRDQIIEKGRNQAIVNPEKNGSFAVAWFFFKISKLGFISTSGLSALAKVSLLVALLLPLKVLLLVNSKEVPDYFPEFLLGYAINDLVLVLAGISVLLYGFHIIAKKMELGVISLAVSNITSNLNTVVQIQNQDDLLKSAYESCSKALSGSLIVILACAVLMLINPEVGKIFSVYLMLTLVCVLLGKNKIELLKRKSRKETVEMIGWFLTVGFFLVFLYIINSAINDEVTDVFAQIVALLIVRQVSSIIQEVGSRIALIKDKEVILSSILFGVHYREVTSDDQASGWDQVFNACTLALEKNGYSVCGKHFFDTAHPMIDSVRLLCKKQDGHDCDVIARIFWGQKPIQFEKEVMLRDEVRSWEVFGDKIADINSDSFSAILVEMPCGEKVVPEHYFAAISQYYRVIYTLSLDEEFVERCKRSEKNSFNTIEIERLKDLVANQFYNVDRDLFNWFFEHYVLILDRVEASPLALVNKDLNLISTVYDGDAVFINSWWHWALEPVGSGIVPEQMNNLDIESIAKVLADQYGYSSEYAEEMIMLNAYCYTLSMNCKQGFMVKACETLSQIRSIIDK